MIGCIIILFPTTNKFFSFINIIRYNKTIILENIKKSRIYFFKFIWMTYILIIYIFQFRIKY